MFIVSLFNFAILSYQSEFQTFRTASYRLSHYTFRTYR